MRNAVGGGLLFKIAVLAFFILSITSCGGGGGGGTGSGTPDGGGSNLFVADSVNLAVGSLTNTHPSPGAIPVDRIITGTGFFSSPLSALYLDVARDQLYVASGNEIVVFNNAKTASGAINFNRSFGSPTTSLAGDPVHDDLYAGSPNEIRVYHNPSAASGIVSPTRTLRTADMGVTLNVQDIAYDKVQDILYVAVDTFGISGSPSMSIFAFNNASALPDGTVTPNSPSRSITISTSTYGTMALFIDSAHDRLYFAPSDPGIFVIPSASTVNGAPTGSSFLLTGIAKRITVDVANDRLYAAAGVAGLFIVPGASTATGAIPVGTVAALPASGGSFTAVAIRQ